MIDRVGPIEPNLPEAERHFRAAADADDRWHGLFARFSDFEQRVHAHPVFAGHDFAVQNAFFVSCDRVLGRSG